MDAHLLIIILYCLLLVQINCASISEKENAEVKTEFVIHDIKIHYYTNRDKKVNSNVQIKNIFFDLETTKEYVYKETTSYNESVGIELLCYGTNLPVNHTLTWHIVIGSQEIATIRRNSNKPSSNFTLYYNLGIFDNETRFYCSLDSSETVAKNSDDFFIQMNNVTEMNYFEIAYCNVSHGFTPRKRCRWRIDAVSASRLYSAYKREVDHAEDFDYIVPEFYNSLFSTVTHHCEDGDTSIIKHRNGTAVVTDTKSFSFSKSDSGTILFCMRLNTTIQTEKGSTALTRVTRDAYNQRVCLYNENLFLEDKIKPGIVITMLVLFFVVIVLISCLRIIIFVHHRVTKRGKKPKTKNADNRNDIDLMQHVNGIWKKWKR